MKLLYFAFWFVCVSMVTAKRWNIIKLDKNSVCHIKKTCLDCLRLPQCTWCANNNKCFSEKLIIQKGHCDNATIHHINYGMSIKENAECSCAGGNMERHCIRPGAAQKEECSGRGQCVCGRCFCESNPDYENPTKAIMGEYCEYDNFNCDGPKCNEGPYNINEQIKNDEDSPAIPEADTSLSLEE